MPTLADVKRKAFRRTYRLKAIVAGEYGAPGIRKIDSARYAPFNVCIGINNSTEAVEVFFDGSEKSMYMAAGGPGDFTGIPFHSVVVKNLDAANATAADEIILTIEYDRNYDERYK